MYSGSICLLDVESLASNIVRRFRQDLRIESRVTAAQAGKGRFLRRKHSAPRRPGINQDSDVNTRKKVDRLARGGAGKCMRCPGWLIPRKIFRSCCLAPVLSSLRALLRFSLRPAFGNASGKEKPSTDERAARVSRRRRAEKEEPVAMNGASCPFLSGGFHGGFLYGISLLFALRVTPKLGGIVLNDRNKKWRDFSWQTWPLKSVSKICKLAETFLLLYLHLNHNEIRDDGSDD